jgi:hypothetical protein
MTPAENADSPPPWLGRTLDEVFENHDPDRAPWCDWSREELAAAVARSECPEECEFYNQFLADKMSLEELTLVNHGKWIGTALADRYQAKGLDQLVYFYGLGAQIALAISRELPPPSGLHNIN